MKRFYKNIAPILLSALAAYGCQEDDLILPKEEIVLTPIESNTVAGLYLLNEGNMNSNKATIDYFDYATGIYNRNIYGQANPNSTLGLGDVGNDIGIYGSKLYAVINNSNKVEVMDAKTVKRVGVIDIKNCRYITFARGKAYVSAYNSGVAQKDGSSVNGYIAEIDTTTFEILRTVTVGRQPEEMSIEVVGNKLYVANSGGYNPPDYERTVSVVDLESFTKIKEIDVALNLHHVKLAPRGELYVSSRGDYYDIPSRLHVIDTATDEVIRTYEIPCANLAMWGDKAYVIGSEFNNTTFKWTITYHTVDMLGGVVLEESFLSKTVEDRITMPYGLNVDLELGHIFITDAKDYVSPGKLFCINQAGELVFEVTAGDIPAHMTFLSK